MTSQIAACVEKPKPRECKTVPEILAHYPTLQDYLSTVDMDEVILASRRGLGMFVHAYAQDGFRTVGDQIQAVVTAYCENTRHQALAAAREEGRRDMEQISAYDFVLGADANALLEVLSRAKCEDCGGTGERTDAEPGDISFHSWVCASCDGKGWNKQAVTEIMNAVDPVHDQQATRNLPTNAPEEKGE